MERFKTLVEGSDTF